MSTQYTRGFLVKPIEQFVGQRRSVCADTDELYLLANFSAMLPIIGSLNIWPWNAFIKSKMAVMMMTRPKPSQNTKDNILTIKPRLLEMLEITKVRIVTTMVSTMATTPTTTLKRIDCIA